MANLLEVEPETVLQQIQVIALLLGRPLEIGVRHQDSRREVVGQRHAAERTRLVRREGHITSQAVQRVPAFQKADLVG